MLMPKRTLSRLSFFMMETKSKMVASKWIKQHFDPTILQFGADFVQFLQVDWQTNGKQVDQYLKQKYYFKQIKLATVSKLHLFYDFVFSKFY